MAIDNFNFVAGITSSDLKAAVDDITSFKAL
jgi:hypothetical protein